jgi:hypothetical protein
MVDAFGPPLSRPFAVINQGADDEAWDGSPVMLLPNQSVLMAVTPVGSTVLAFQNESPQNTPATLALTAGSSAPVFLTAPPLVEQPNSLVRNWRGVRLGITNITPPDMQVPVLVQLVGPALPWVSPADLPADGAPVPLGPGQAAQGTTLQRWMQVILQANPDAPTVFAIIGGPPNASGNNAYVVALNAPQNSGPGTENPPPAGYFATTRGAVYTYQLNWGAAPVFVANMSGAGAAPGSVGLRPL